MPKIHLLEPKLAVLPGNIFGQKYCMKFREYTIIEKLKMIYI